MQRLDDGLLEVSLVQRPKNKFLFAEIIATLTSLQKNSQYIYTCKTKELVLHTKEPVSWTLVKDSEANVTNRRFNAWNSPWI